MPGSLGQMSPLVQQYGEFLYGYSTGPGLPRPVSEFLTGAFGPLSPIRPIPIDPSADGVGGPEPRRFELPIGWNMPVGVPGSEGLKLVNFAVLRAVSDAYSVVRACVQVRKEEILGIDYDIVPTTEAEKAIQDSPAARKDFENRRKQVMAFFARPDPEYRNYHGWLSTVLEHIFVDDALALYLHPPRTSGKGVLGSNLAALEIIDGTTIRPLLNIHGARPRPPAPAYQQYLYGVPRVDLMSFLEDGDLLALADAGMPTEPDDHYAADQLLYLPYTTRSWTPYGFPATERAIVPIITGIKRQQWALDYFVEGSVPQAFVMPGEAVSNPEQIMQLQNQLNAIAGDVAWKHRIVVLPSGSRIQEMKEKALSDAFDAVIDTQVFMAFDVQPTELGVMPGHGGSGGAGLGGQGMMEGNQNIQERKATKPLLMWLKRSIFDYVIQVVCGQDDMEWRWAGMGPVEDQQLQETIQNARVANGTASIDEVRVLRGEQPFGLPYTTVPFVMAGSGPFLLNQDPSAQQQAQQAPPSPTGGQPPQPPSGGQPSSKKPEDTPDASEAPTTPLHETQQQADEAPEKPVTKAALAELDALYNYLRHKRDPAKFEVRELTPEHVAKVVELVPELGLRAAIEAVKITM